MPANNTRTIFYFVKFFKPYTLSIIAAFLFLISARIAATAEPLYLKRLIDALTTNSALDILSQILIGYFLIRFAGVLFEFLRDYVFSPVVMGVSRDIEVAVFDHLLKLPVSYHADQKSGAAARAIARGSRAITFVLDFSVAQILPPIFELAFVSILLLSLYSWHYGVITLATVAIYAWFTIWSTEKRQKYRIEGNMKDDASSGILVDSVTNMDTVKYFHSERHQFGLFTKIKEEWLRLMVRNNRLFAAIYGLQGIILLIGLGLILILSVRQASAGILTVGDLVLLSTYIVRLSIPITTLGFVYGQFKNSFADLDAMSGILAQEISVKEPLNPVKLNDVVGSVVFQHVSFAYPGRDKIIDDLSFAIEPGQKVAFVGPSGTGKSTLAKLIFRLFDIDKGEVLLSGANVQTLSAEDRKSLLAIVPQEPMLFNDSIANNITFGKPNATRQEVIEAAKAAHIHDFIDSLPDKYDTVVGERGMKISGGQKQRIAIARAVIKNPKVMIFDEATSSLDSKSEQAILKTLNEVAKGRTTIAIAHRLSTIINSDVIYVMQKGKIVEMGKHSELLAKNGTYANLWKLQSQAQNQKNENEPVLAV